MGNTRGVKCGRALEESICRKSAAKGTPQHGCFKARHALASTDAGVLPAAGIDVDLVPVSNEPEECQEVAKVMGWELENNRQSPTDTS